MARDPYQADTVALSLLRINYRLDQAEAKHAFLDSKLKELHTVGNGLHLSDLGRLQRSEQGRAGLSVAFLDGLVTIDYPVQDEQEDIEDLQIEQHALHKRLGQMHEQVDQVDQRGRKIDGLSQAFANAARANLPPESHARLVKNFHKHARPRLYKPDQIQKLCGDLEAQLEEMEQTHAEECAILLPLETLTVEAACVDPGALHLPQLILPLIREQLEAAAGIQPHLRSDIPATSRRMSLQLPALHLDRIQLPVTQLFASVLSIMQALCRAQNHWTTCVQP
ncbi:hypothetical protein WJX82_004044 [Trebouxia sp. C0006]